MAIQGSLEYWREIYSIKYKEKTTIPDKELRAILDNLYTNTTLDVMDGITLYEAELLNT